MNNQGHLAPFNRVPWMDFKNTGATTIPPHGIIEIEESERSDTSSIEWLKGKRPTKSYVRVFAVNGPKEVEANGYGVCCQAGECYVKIDTGDIPGVGKIIGPKKDDFYGQMHHYGLVVTGDVNTSSSGLARVRFVPDTRNVVRFLNTSGVTCPFGSAMIIDGDLVTYLGEGIHYRIKQPTTDIQQLVLINLQEDVPDNEYGWACWLTEAPGWAAYDVAGGTPAKGNRYGIKQGQWTLAKNRYGFLVQSAAKTVNGVECINVLQTEVTRLRGKTDSAITKGSFGTVSIYDGAEIDTSINLTSVYNVFADLDSDKVVFIEELGGRWDIYAAEC